ncbi:U-box domain-containing protein 33-like isoform X2 [Tasmannia lanceolata]|uniref:U-box domain-containing protein 33-like isoform X2 n=1 Tax=Tasmannia lanceolata TaxID=3420 RepID=UPI0040639EE6
MLGKNRMEENDPRIRTQLEPGLQSVGKLPASQANEVLVSAYRREEREQTKKLLFNYLSICYRSKVQASIVTIENEHVHEGIVELVSRHGIRKLVMGSAPDNCMKMKRSSSKANYTAKNAPQFCEIWFVNKGKNVWTRESSEGPTSLNAIRDGAHTEPDKREVVICTPEFPFSNGTGSLNSESSKGFTSTSSGLSSPTDRRFSSDTILKEEVELEILNNQLVEARLEAERSKKEATAEILNRKRLESKTKEAINKIKASEAAYAREVEVRNEVEDTLKTTKQELEKLSEQRDEALRELQKTMRNLTILDVNARETAHHRDEAAGELKLIQASVTTLRHERKKIRRQREDSVRRLERWRSVHARAPNYDGFNRFINQSSEFSEFSLSDLRTATCDFSESFKITEGGYGCVYKGEMLDRSVAIKKLHPYNLQGQSEFQQEVQVRSKLKHPHLVTLIGACQEDWSLVYEYLPNGSLQDCLFCKTKTPPLTWKARLRIAAEIASALLFLHSSKPEKIIHGDLKLKNIFLNSEFKCKIGDFGISRLVSDEIIHFPTFRCNTEPKGSFPYTDPEFQRNGVMTPKSDIYSFGIIILQLLTGRPPMGLASEVRRAMLSGKLASVLDLSAGEWPSLAAGRLAELGLQCSEINSRDRPELTPTVVRQLECLYVAEERPVPDFFLCPILKEIMHDPQLAADGHTYEGEALRRWLDNGCETSPMTNLKLKHLNLTPNHALRFAIQDWLCQF